MVVVSAIRSAPASSSSNLHGRVRQGLSSSSTSRAKRRQQRRHDERRRRARDARRWHARDARRSRSAADARRRLPPRPRHPRLATHTHRRRRHRGSSRSPRTPTARRRRHSSHSTRTHQVARHLRSSRHLAQGLGGQWGRRTILSRRSAGRARRSTGRATKWANRSAARPMPSAQPFATWGSSWRALAALRAEHDTHQQLAHIGTEREVSSPVLPFLVRTCTTHRSYRSRIS